MDDIMDDNAEDSIVGGGSQHPLGNSRTGRKMEKGGAERCVELIVSGLSDTAVIARLQKEGFLLNGDTLSERMMYHYRAMPEAKPLVRHMNLRAQQLGSVAYSESVTNTIRIMRAANRKLLRLDENGEDMIDADIEDSKMLKALMDAHFKAHQEIIAMFTPEVRTETVEDANDLLETALVEMVEGLAEKAAQRRLEKRQRASASQDNNEDE